MDENKTIDSENEAMMVSRRRLLQVLAATGVVVGMEKLLPGGWVTPSAEAAPEAPNPMIGDMQMYFLPINSAGYFNTTVRFRYSDPAEHILSNAPISAKGPLQGIIADNQPIGNIGGSYIPVNAAYGTMRFPLPYPSYINTTEEIKLGVVDSYNPSRFSNVIAAGFNVGNYGVLNISSLLVVANPLLNVSTQSAEGPDCELTAVFDYNGSIGGMVTANTSVYAWLNSSGWVSPGGSIANMGGHISPVDNFSGRVRLPLTQVTNGYFGNQPDDLCLTLEGHGLVYHYATPEVMKSFVACGRPAILSLSNQLCSPSVQDGTIGCKYNVTLEYYDASSKMSGDSKVTVMYNGETLINDSSFSELGATVPNPVQGFVTIEVLIPTTGVANGAAHDMDVQLRNDDGVQSEPESTLVTMHCDPVPQFPLGIETSGAWMAGNASIHDWRVAFEWDDSAGILDELAQIGAVVNSAGVITPIFNGMPLGNVGGLTINGSHSFFPNSALNCTIAPVTATFGSGHFAFNFSTLPTLSAAADEEVLPTLSWFLVKPSFRESDTETVVLDPDAGPPPADDYRAFIPVARSD